MSLTLTYKVEAPSEQPPNLKLTAVTLGSDFVDMSVLSTKVLAKPDPKYRPTLTLGAAANFYRKVIMLSLIHI